MVAAQALRSFGRWGTAFMRANWKGTLVIAAAVAIFFWPLILHIGSYSPGGDAMFNAWEMRRNQNCILRQHCPVYTDANIFFPNKDTMLYSESQLSAGAITLPLYFLSDNPILAYNLLTVVSFFLAGWFMYLLAKRLSRGNEYWSIIAGLLFAFAPVRLAAIFHLQNLSIMCLPLAVLMIVRFFDLYRETNTPDRRKLKKPRPAAIIEEKIHYYATKTGQWMGEVYRESLPGKRYIIGLFLALLYVCFASWVQMVFVLIALAVLLFGLLIGRVVRIRAVVPVVLTIALAVLAVMPLALQYVQFGKINPSPFGLKDQLLYSSSVADYFIPQYNTLLGSEYYKAPHRIINSYNPDSYSYMGLVVYAAAALVCVLAFRFRKHSDDAKQRFRVIVAFVAVGLVGFLVSLGPFLKLRDHWFRVVGEGIKIVVPLPWYVVDKFLPQLAFVRALGRAAVLVLFALCCLLALMPLYLKLVKSRRLVYAITAVVTLCMIIELVPIHQVPMAQQSFNYNLSIPPVYRYIKAHKEVDNFIILVTDYDYKNAPIPTARAEQVLWAGYHNRNIFDGYSGIEPPNYVRDHEDYNDFYADDIPKMKAIGLQYVLVDKKLCTNHPDMPGRVDSILSGTREYSDTRFSLYKLP